MSFKLAIFDMDGTILNTIDDLTDSCNVLLEQYGLPTHTVDEFKFFVGNGIPKAVERALPQGTDEAFFKKFLAEYIEYYENHCAIKTAPYKGIPECIKTLRFHGVKIAVNTNKIEPAAIELCNNYFPGLFDIISGSRPGMPPKPAPDGIFEILERAGMTKEEAAAPDGAVFIGDSDVDIQTGLNAGINVIGVDWGFRGRDFLLRHKAPRVVMSPLELVAEIVQD
ncbi:MAG: HAD family hydrolase [Treponema sp.]|nr:HAD family hydrolase [Treponema sp.]